MTLLRIVRESDIAAAAGGRVEVRGTYAPCHVTARPHPTGPAIHAAVELVDGTRVLLEPPYLPSAHRSDAERATHAGRPVRAVGTLLATVPEESPGAATPLLPCLVDVEVIEPA